MNLRNYFDLELKTAIVYAAAGVAMGYASFTLNNSLVSLGAALVVAGVLKLVLEKLMNAKQDSKWWLGHGVVLYLFVWFVFWTIFYNVSLR